MAGNHDAELVLASVQRELCRLLGASERNLHVCDQLAWPDLIIEHGHQSDPDACFFPDTRTAVRKRRLSALPLACLITRLLLSDIPRFALMGDNHRTPLQVLLRVLRDYRLAAFEMIARYPVAGVRIVMHSVRARRRGDVPASIHASTMASPLEVARRLYLDRYFAAVCALPLAVAAAWQWVPAWVWWPLSVLVLGLAVPPARRADFAGRDALAGTRVAHAHARAGVRLVVHGHTHRAFVERIAHGALYANHGAFSQVHAAPAARGVWARPYLAIDADAATCRLMTHPCGDACERGDPWAS
jgi:UDP-2,3-diacylglucosamine pyrophosphatase LpxH